MAALQSENHGLKTLIRDRRIKFLLGTICSGLFLILAFRNVQWSQLGAALLAVDWGYLLVATGLYVLNLITRGLRWRVLLVPVGSVTIGETFAYVNIGYMANDLLPLRAGEIIRAVLLGERRGISKSAVLATIAVERWLDILALLVLTVVLIAVTPIPGEVRQGILAASVLAGLGTVGLWWAVVRQGLGWYWDTWLPRIPQRLTRAIVGIARSFVDGLAAMRSPRQALTAAFYSILAWGVVCGSTYLVLRACHLDLPWYATLLIIVMVNFGSAIPSSPGFIGVAHFLAVTALSPWAVDSDVALSFALVFHAMPFLLTLILGLGSIWWAGIAFRRMAQVRTETQ